MSESQDTGQAPNHLDGRFTDLESRVAHQEAMIQDLSTTAAKQWAVIDEMTLKIRHLTDMIKALEAEMSFPSSSDEAPPPHY